MTPTETPPELEQLYDDWFYEFATEEADGTHTLVIHEVHDGDAYSKFETLMEAYVTKTVVDELERLYVKAETFYVYKGLKKRKVLAVPGEHLISRLEKLSNNNEGQK